MKAKHGLTLQQVEIIRLVLAPFASVISRVDLFGSRAMGNYRPNSDVDLVIHGSIAEKDIDRLWTLFSESALPFSVDIKSYELTKYAPLKRHMSQAYQTLFTSEQLNTKISTDFKDNIEKDYVVLVEEKEVEGLPEGWREVKLGEVACFKTGKLNSNAAVAQGAFPFFTCSPETLRINNYSFDEKAILLAGNNANGNFNIKIYNGKFNAYQRTYIINNNSMSNLTYLFYAIQCSLGYFKEISQGTATKFLTIEILKNLALRLPPLPEQKAVAHILGSLDDRIALLRETNATLEAMAQAIFKSWFVDFDPVHAKAAGKQPEGMDTATAALFPDSFEKSELGMIPKGWQVGGLTDIADYLNGLALQKYPAIGSNWLPVIKISQLKSGIVTNADRASASIPVEYIVHDGDVLFSWSGSLEVVIWCAGNGALNQHLFKVTSTKFPKWFYYFWTKYHLKSFKEIAAGKATTMGHIQRKHLSEARLLIPIKNLIVGGNKIIEPLLEQIITNQKQIRTLTTLRDTLLPRLISGKLRVKNS